MDGEEGSEVSSPVSVWCGCETNYSMEVVCHSIPVAQDRASRTADNSRATRTGERDETSLHEQFTVDRANRGSCIDLLTLL